jgi:hypothetical protein
MASVEISSGGTQPAESPKNKNPYRDPDLLEAFTQFDTLPENRRIAFLSEFVTLADERYPHHKPEVLFKGFLSMRKSRKATMSREEGEAGDEI